MLSVTYKLKSQYLSTLETSVTGHNFSVKKFQCELCDYSVLGTTVSKNIVSGSICKTWG